MGKVHIYRHPEFEPQTAKRSTARLAVYSQFSAKCATGAAAQCLDLGGFAAKMPKNFKFTFFSNENFRK
jgi:hypothetical protein